MVKREIEIGPAGASIATRLAAHRRMLGMTQAEVSAGVSEYGRTLTAASIGEIERGSRRIDVDDFLALCRTIHLDTAKVILEAEQEMIDERRRKQEDAIYERSAAAKRARDITHLAGANPRNRMPGTGN